jgi:hypothetical protein
MYVSHLNKSEVFQRVYIYFLRMLKNKDLKNNGRITFSFGFIHLHLN